MSDERELPPIGRPTTPRPGQRRIDPQLKRTQQIVGIGVLALLAVFTVLGNPFQLGAAVVPAGGGTDGMPAAPTIRDVTRSRYDHIDIRLVCEGMVRERMLSPSSMRVLTRHDDRPVWDGINRSWRWRLDVEAQNAFGVWLRGTWSCVTDEDTDLITVIQVR